MTLDLGRLREEVRARVPVAGTWTSPPHPVTRREGRDVAVLVEDAVWILGLDRATGALWAFPGDGKPSLVNTSFDAFVACCETYVATLDGGDPRSDEGERTLAERLLAQLRAIDPAAVADENQLWAVAAEELGYGL